MKEGEATSTKSTDIKIIIWEYYEQLHTKKFRKLTRNGEILDIHKLPKIIQKENRKHE